MTEASPPVPPHSDLLGLFQAALANSKGLLRDAQLLADAASFPRAFALAILSWEELSKAHLCLLAALLDEMTPEDFWKGFRDHAGKLNRAHAFADFMQPAPLGPVAEHAKKVTARSKSTDKQKHRGLYVDYRGGKILLPSQIGEAAARKQIKLVREALAFADAAFSAGPLDDLIAQVRALTGSGLKNAIVADPDATAAAMQEALLGGSQANLQRLMAQYALTDRSESSTPSPQLNP